MCDHLKQVICDEERCGICYEKELLFSRDKVKSSSTVIEFVKDTHGHMAMKIRKGLANS